MNDDQELMLRVEAVLMTADRPLGERKIASILDLLAAGSADDSESSDEEATGKDGKPSGRGPVADIRAAVSALNDAYEAAGRSFRIEQVAGGLQVLTLPEFAGDIARLIWRLRRYTPAHSPTRQAALAGLCGAVE